MSTAAGTLPPLSDLVYPKEKRYYAIMLAVSLIVYAALAYAILQAPGAVIPVAFYVVIGAIAYVLIHGMTLGRLRGSGIRVSPTQLPAVHQQIRQHAQTMGIEGGDVPDVYVIASGGVLNAFATRFLGRDFVVIHADVLELAMQQGESAVGFIVAHELAHHKRGHLKRRWLTYPGHFVPYLGFAYSRACEYTCDAFAARCQPDGAVPGLLALAAGKQLFKTVNAEEFARQAKEENDFWVRRAEIFSTHPRLPKRVARALEIGSRIPAYSPMQTPERRPVTH